VKVLMIVAMEPLYSGRDDLVTPVFSRFHGKGGKFLKGWFAGKLLTSPHFQAK
jgi:hypothetical protein